MPRRKKMPSKKPVVPKKINSTIEIVPLIEDTDVSSEYGYCQLPSSVSEDAELFSARRARTLLSITTWDGRSIFQLDTKA